MNNIGEKNGGRWRRKMRNVADGGGSGSEVFVMQLLYAITAGRSFSCTEHELKRRKRERLSLQKVTVDGCENRTKFDFRWCFFFASDAGEFFGFLRSTYCKGAFIAA